MDGLLFRSPRQPSQWLCFNIQRASGTWISGSTPPPLLLLDLYCDYQICTRLPSSESDFESGESSILGGFLSEAMAISDHTVLTPFTENIVLATICGRTLSHRHQTAVERAYGDLSQDCWARHSWLHGILAARVRALSHSCSPISDPINPLVPFTALVAHATVLTLYDIAQALPCTPDTLHLGTLSAYESYAISAAYEIASLAEMFRQSSSFKASVPSD